MILTREVGGVGRAVAASIWTEGGNQIFFLLYCGGGLVGEAAGFKKAAASRMEGEHKKAGFTRAGLAGGNPTQMEVCSGRWAPDGLPAGPCLYLWVTWLLRRPGNVCSVSVLNEPPSRDRQSYHLHPLSFFHISYQQFTSTDTCRGFLPFPTGHVMTTEPTPW